MNLHSQRALDRAYRLIARMSPPELRDLHPVSFVQALFYRPEVLMDRPGLSFRVLRDAPLIVGDKYASAYSGKSHRGLVYRGRLRRVERYANPREGSPRRHPDS